MLSGGTWCPSMKFITSPICLQNSSYIHVFCSRGMILKVHCWTKWVLKALPREWIAHTAPWSLLSPPPETSARRNCRTFTSTSAASIAYSRCRAARACGSLWRWFRLGRRRPIINLGRQRGIFGRFSVVLCSLNDYRRPSNGAVRQRGESLLHWDFLAILAATGETCAFRRKLSRRQRQILVGPVVAKIFRNIVCRSEHHFAG